MPINKNDLALLQDMIKYCREIIMSLKNSNINDFNNNSDKRLATERRLEIIGIAARKISQETHKSLPDIPWKEIIGLQNVLAHDYTDIRHDLIWEVTQDYIPQLYETLNKINELDDYTTNNYS